MPQAKKEQEDKKPLTERKPPQPSDKQEKAPGKQKEAPIQPPPTAPVIISPRKSRQQQPSDLSQTPEAVFLLYSQGKEVLMVEDASDFFNQLQFSLEQGDSLIAFYLLHAESFEMIKAVEVERYCRE